MSPPTGVDDRGAKDTINKRTLHICYQSLLSSCRERLYNLVLSSNRKMDAIRVTRSDLVGKSKSDTLVMETLIRANALNRTGDVNYNESGIKDGVGFEEVTEKFVDNFLF